MSGEIPKTEPSQIVAGDSVQWQKTFENYPAGTWTLSYVLVNATNKYTITATASAEDFLVSLATTDTSSWAAGHYAWQAYLTATGQRITIEQGEIDIVTNFSAAASYDTRSQAQITYEAIEAVIAGRATKDQQMYMIGGRRLQLTPIPDLIVLRDKYKAIWNSEKNAEGIKNGSTPKNKVFVRI